MRGRRRGRTGGSGAATVVTMTLGALCALVTPLGCGGHGVSASAASIVSVGPPQPIAEAPPRRPRAGAVWAAGHWAWTPGGYAWRAGRWVVPPRPGVAYVPPRWVAHGPGWVQLPPRWVPAETVDRFGRRLAFDALGRPLYF